MFLEQVKIRQGQQRMSGTLKLLGSQRKLIAVLVASIVAFVSLAQVFVQYLNKQHIEQQIETAINNTLSLAVIRKSVLTEAILSPDFRSKQQSHDQALRDQLSLVDKLTIHLSKVYTGTENIQVRVVPNINVNGRLGVQQKINESITKDEALNSAWNTLGQSDAEFITQLTSRNGSPGISVVVPDKLSVECVGCHILEETKTEQKLAIGDTVGLIEAFIPFQSNSTAITQFYWQLIVFTALLTITFFLVDNIRKKTIRARAALAANLDNREFSRENLLASMEGIPDALLLVSEGKVLACNNAALNLFFFPNKQVLLKKNVAEIFLWELDTDGNIVNRKKTIEETIRESAENGVSSKYFQISRLDREEVPVEAFFKEVPWNRETVTQVLLKPKRNLRKESDNEDSVSQEFEHFLSGFKLLADSLEFGVGIAELNGTAIYENKALASLTKGEIGKTSFKGNFRDYYAPWALEKIETEVMPGLLSKGEWSGELELRSKSGKVYPTKEKFFYLYKGDRPHLIVDIIVNLSEQRTLEKSLVENRRLAAAASQSKSLFLANMSHEIHTPLNAILGYAELLQRDASIGAENKAIARTICRSGKHLLTVINSILDMSNINAGKLALSEVDFDLYALLDDLSVVSKSNADIKGIEFKLSYTNTVPQYVYGDQSKLQQVLTNLLNNAVKYTQEGNVSLEVSSLEENLESIKLRFKVSDTGIGINERNLTRIFKPFIQSGDRESLGGAGLGLSISKKIVELMGGDIKVASEVGNGSQFSVDLSLLKSTVEHLVKHSRTSEVIGLESSGPVPSILIVDDIAINRDLLVRYLKPLGFPVIEANNGQQAIEVFKSQSPKIVLIDVVMPEMDGIEATRKIRGLPGGDQAIIIAVTASAMESEIESIKQAGADDIHRKPVNLDVLLKLITQHTGMTLVYPDKIAINSESNAQLELLEKKFSELPSEIKIEMQHALKVGQLARLRELVIPLQQLDPEIGSAFETMIDNYQLKELKLLYRE